MLKLDYFESIYLQEIEYVYDKCKRDPYYFLDNYYDMLHFDESIGSDIFDFKEKVFEIIDNNMLSCIEGGKNTTKTTMATAYAVWTCLFKQDQNVLYITTDDANRKQVMDRIVAAINMMPSFLFDQLPQLSVSHPQDLLFILTKSAFRVRKSSVLKEPLLYEKTPLLFNNKYDLLILDDYAYYDDSFTCDINVNKMIDNNENMKVVMISSSNPVTRNAFDEKMKILRKSFVPYSQVVNNE